MLEGSARQHDTVSAGEAFQPNIGAQAHNPPLIPAARMRFPHPDDIIKIQVLEHGCIIPPGSVKPYRSIESQHRSNPQKFTDGEILNVVKPFTGFDFR